MFVRSDSEDAETSILIKLMQEKEVALKEATSLLESEKTKQSDEVNLSQYSCESCSLQEVKSQLADSLSNYKRKVALIEGAYSLIILYYTNRLTEFE